MDGPEGTLPPFRPDPNPRVVSPPIGRGAHMGMPAQAPGPSMNVGDIYYILFRHKWKILLCSLFGFGVAAGIYFFMPTPYQSEAKLFIRYVTEARTAGPLDDETRTKSPDQRGETIINSEVQILTSLDLATQVANSVGPDKILKGIDDHPDLAHAAGYVQANLVVEAPLRSSVIEVKFKHPDPEMVQPVLREVVGLYLKRHAEVHQSAGIVGDFLSKETDNLRSRLAGTEDALRKALAQAGVISLEDSRKNLAEEMARLRKEMLVAQAELAQRASIYNEYAKRAAPKGDEKTPVEMPSQEVIDEYQAVSAKLQDLQKRERELLEHFRPESTRVTEVKSQVKEVASQKAKLEQDNPMLAKTVPLAGSNSPTMDLVAEAAYLTSLEAKIKVLNEQLNLLRTEAAKLDDTSALIVELRRKKEIEEANYLRYAAGSEQARIADAVGTGTISNIVPVQTPSPPFVDKRKLLKIVGAIAAAGVVLGFGWAFLIEFYLDRTIRRPVDVENILRLPLFLAIPKLVKKKKKLLKNGAAPTNGAIVPAGATIPPWDGGHALHPFHETLRDRLIGYFESQGLTHKPKLVAVTGLGRGSGVTTIAAGLAGSLSETGDGNVLLVDMTATQGSSKQFYHGAEVCGLEQILDTRQSAQVEGNLFVVGEEPAGDRLGRMLPQRFSKLIPKLKASDFDYIIFDMPPVSQISITPRLAGFMDMVLLVIESEKTDQELVQRATALLAESKAHVGAVLNKNHTYVPSRLHQEYLGNT